MRNIIHIGMPKTGTTTLQADVFPHIAAKTDYRYLGLFQPHRKLQQSATISALHHWVMNGSDEAALFSAVSREVSTSPLIVSNETILSSNVHSCWRTRIGRLQKVVEEFNFVVYLTVREPITAMHSYFVEHYLDSPIEHRESFIEEVLHGERLQIYRYADSIPFIEDTLKTDVIVESYENVIQRWTSPFLSSLTWDGKPFPDTVGDHNRKRRNEGSVVFENTTLRDTLRRQVYCSPLGRNPFARKVIARLGMVTKLLDLVQMPPVVVPAITEREIAMLAQELHPDLDFVASR